MKTTHFLLGNYTAVIIIKSSLVFGKIVFLKIVNKAIYYLDTLFLTVSKILSTYMQQLGSSGAFLGNISYIYRRDLRDGVEVVLFLHKNIKFFDCLK